MKITFEDIELPAAREFDRNGAILRLDDNIRLFIMADASAFIQTADALIRAYRAGQRSFTNISLSSVDLSQADLKGADLSYADFSEANLSEANLRGADLSYAALGETNLTGADLRGAMLIGTDLRNAILADTRLQGADYDPEETHFPKGFDVKAADMRPDR